MRRHLLDDLAALHHEANGGSAWRWRRERTPPSDHAIAATGFHGAVWADGLPRDAPNLLLLLHGLGDTCEPFARFASKMRLPSTSALSLPAPLPLPHDMPGGMWHDSFEADGTLITDDSAGQRRQLQSLEGVTRPRLRALLRLLVEGCGWRLERIFFFGFAQGGTAALDLISRTSSIERELPHALTSPARMGGVVSWCGLPLEVAAQQCAQNAADGEPGCGGALGSRTPLLLVSGENDARARPDVARSRFDRLRSGWCLARDQQAPFYAPTEQALHVMPGKRQEMVRGTKEAKLLMEFFARHLSLSSALEDDPDVVRVS